MIWTGLLLTLLSGAGRDEPSEPVPPDYAEFLVIPLHVHILTSEALPEADCKLTDADIARIVGKVNRVWTPAGIHFGVETLRHEPAAHEDRYRALRDLVESETPPHRIFGGLRPDATRSDAGLHVYYVHDFDVNGVYMGRGFAFVRETASLREVEGGLDEPLPRVTAHELGHALGLPHRQARTNLLASGTTGTSLNRDEIATAREKARAIPGALGVADVRAEAATAIAQEDLPRARRRLGWLAEIPGEPAEAARKQLDALP